MQAEREGPKLLGFSVIRSANLPRPLMAGAISRQWQRRTNLWRERTNLSPRGPAASKK